MKTLKLGSKMKVVEMEKKHSYELDDAMWIITRDLINVPHPALPAELTKSEVGTCSKNAKEGIKMEHKFRMLDGDREIYYYGKSSCNSSFAPLDDFGMGNSGCTEIQYYENGKWKTL